MKIYKLAFTLITIFSNVLFAEIDTDKFIRLNVDLNDVIKAENKIIIYGSNGSLLISEDNTKSWIQKSISDSLNIIKLKYTNGNLYGLAQNYNSFKLYEFEYNINTSLLNLSLIDIKFANLGDVVSQENIDYLGTKSNIYSYNLVTKELKSVYKDSLNIFQNHNSFTLIDSFLIIPSSNNKLIRFNLYSKKTEYIQNKDYEFSNVKILNYKNNLYSICNNKLIISRDIGKTWDSLHFVESSSLFATNNNLYLCKNDFKNRNISLISNNGLSYNFNENNNLLFNNFIENYIIKAIFNVDSNITLAIGVDKLILKSSYNSQSWSLVSSINRKKNDLRINFFDNNYGIAYTNYKQFYKTFDGGTTWIPINTSSSYSSINSSTYLGYSFFGNNGSFFYLDEASLTQYTNNFIYSLDTCKTFNVSSLFLGNFLGVSKIINYKDSIYFISRAYNSENTISFLNTLDSKLNITNNQRFDSLFIHDIYVNNNNNLEMICNERRYHSNKIKGNVSTLYDSSYVTIKESFDNGNTWKNKSKFNNLNRLLILDYNIIGNKILIIAEKDELNPLVNDSKKYLYELSENNYDLIYTFQDSTIGSIIYFNSNLYCFGLNSIYYQDNKLNWIKKFFPSHIGGQNNPYYLSKELLICIANSTQTSDKDLKNIYKYTDESPASDVEAQIEEMTDLVTLSPAPLPANTFTKIEVIWSSIYKFYLSNIEVFDIYGIKVKSNL
ncbi:MAG: hypothetical protein NTW25_06180 [Candidatus Kapabacteria bacterium]|nr:hypothetical protein [Candidatus Kapabacteria bacterium]